MEITATISFVLKLTGAFVLFLYGMKIMSEALQKIAGHKLRQLLRSFTSNHWRAILTGFIITGIIQSSSAFTVMTVGFANAGLVSLTQAAGLIMGANVGTTVTAWLVSFFGFSFNVKSILLPLLALALPFLFSRKANLRYSGEVIFGFVILFLGLFFMKNVIPDLHQNHFLVDLLKNRDSSQIPSILFFVMAGIMLTVVFQSSSAMFAFTLVMSINGFISVEAAAAMILGENVGTTATVNIVALMANRNGKRVALFHFLFNFFGLIWALLLFHPFLNFVQFITDSLLPHTLSNSDFRLSVTLSVFHTIFNIANVLIIIGLIPYLMRITAWVFPLKGKKEHIKSALSFLPDKLMSTSELSLVQARLAFCENAEKVSEMFMAIPELLLEKQTDTFNKIFHKLKSFEKQLDHYESDLYSFLSKITEGELSYDSTRLVRGFLIGISNIETIGDLCYKMARLIKEKNEDKAWFIQQQRDELFEMFKLTDKTLKLMIKNTSIDGSEINKEEVLKLENKINKKRDKMIRELYVYQIKHNLPFESGNYYRHFAELCEEIGDHTLNVAEALAGHKF